MRSGKAKRKIKGDCNLYHYIDKRIWKVRNIDLPLKVNRKSHTDKRKQNKRHLVKIPSRSSDAVRVGLEKIAELYGQSFETVFKSVTSDNGSEFVDLGEARTKSKTLLSLAFSQRESYWITLPMNKLRLSKVGLTICHARSSITTPLILFFNLSYLILQFRK